MKQEKTSQQNMGAALAEHMPAIWRFAFSLAGTPDVADDLAQATCLRAIEKSHQFQEGGTLIGWCLTICRSIWLNELRSKAVRNAGGLESIEAKDLADLSPSVETNIFASEVFTRIMELPEAQRSTVEMVYVQGFSYKEAAETLQVPIGTIMSRLATARKALADLNKEEFIHSKVVKNEI